MFVFQWFMVWMFPECLFCMANPAGFCFRKYHTKYVEQIIYGTATDHRLPLDDLDTSAQIVPFWFLLQPPSGDKPLKCIENCPLNETAVVLKRLEIAFILLLVWIFPWCLFCKANLSLKGLVFENITRRTDHPQIICRSLIAHSII